MIMLIGGRDPILYADSLRSNLPGFTSQLLREGKLSGCLAALPSDKDGRRWLLAFLGSLKRAGGGRVGVVLTASAATADDFADCDAADLDEAVIVQDREETESAIEALLKYRRAHAPNGLGFRVWLDPDAGDSLQRKAGAWKRAVPWLLSLELTPMSWAGAPDSVAPRNGSKPLACDWIRSALTISCSGAVTPCPKHSPQDGLSLATSSAAQVMALRDNWKESLGSHPVCLSCNRFARFSIPGWMKDLDTLMPQTVPQDSFVRFEDLIRRNVGIVEEQERAALLSDFAERVRASMKSLD